MSVVQSLLFFFFFKQKTAYEMRISDWSSDVCSSDLGAYSLAANSPDEQITRDVCAGNYPGEAVPDLIVCVADATNLRLHLRFVLEVKRLGRPVVLALNMMDTARARGIVIDVPELQRRLGLPEIGRAHV